MLTRTIDRRRFLALSGAASAAAILAACGDGSEDSPNAGNGGAEPENATLRLGYFPNLTHVQPNVGLETGTVARVLGNNVKLETKVFNAGPAAIEALFAGEIDATYIGPNPAINGFQRSNGEEVRIVAGSASGGALLVVRPDANITNPGDLADTKLATPQLGNTQDVALRAYLQANGLETKEDGGNVTILPTANADTLTLFQKGQIDGAWVPEPWATRLILEAGGRVFLDERELWPNGDFVTTHLIVSAKFLRQHPGAVERLVRANVNATQFINERPEEAKALVNQGIEALTGKPLSRETINGAWENLRFTYDPIASSLVKSARDAYDAGLLGRDEPDLEGIYALDLLHGVLTDLKLPAVGQ